MQHFIQNVASRFDKIQGLVKIEQGGFQMLNFTIKPGEYFTIGEDIKVVFLGGTANNYKVMVDAPRSYNIVRGKVLEKNAALQEEKEKIQKFYPEPGMSAEQIKRLIAKQKRQNEKDRKQREKNQA